MVVAYVRLSSSLASTCSPSSRVYALLLPSADGNDWAELKVRRSPLGGFGVVPCDGEVLSWNDVTNTPVLLPYLGVETVVKDAFAHDALVEVLKGEFQRVTLAELQARHGGGQTYVENGLFVNPRGAASRGEQTLAPETPLLQIRAAGGRAHYLLADAARTVLHLDGKRAHLFDLLCAGCSRTPWDPTLTPHGTPSSSTPRNPTLTHPMGPHPDAPHGTPPSRPVGPHPLMPRGAPPSLSLSFSPLPRRSAPTGTAPSATAS